MRARSAERELVVLAAREPSDARDRALARCARDVTQWDDVVAVAVAHGVAPLLNQAITSAPWTSLVPLPVQQRLRLLAAATSLANTTSLRTLETLLAALASQRIDVIVLKGPALASTLYSAPRLRPFTDLDVLCRPDQLQAADRALRAAGCAPVAPDGPQPDGFHHIYIADTARLRVELHGDPLQLGLPAGCLADIWRHARPIAFGGQPSRMLEVHDQLLHLCIHLHTHGYSRLIWFKDLDLLLRAHGHEIDWQRLYARAAAEGATASVRHALLLLRDLLETPLPPSALSTRRDIIAEIAHAALWPRRHVCALSSKQRLRSIRFNPRQGVIGVLPNLLAMGRRRDKLRHLLALVRSRLTGSHAPPTSGLSAEGGPSVP